jgi:hypothetical protein
MAFQVIDTVKYQPKTLAATNKESNWRHIWSTTATKTEIEPEAFLAQRPRSRKKLFIDLVAAKRFCRAQIV